MKRGSGQTERQDQQIDMSCLADQAVNALQKRRFRKFSVLNTNIFCDGYTSKIIRLISLACTRHIWRHHKE